MSEDISTFIDEITELRLLYSLRENMQRYFKGEREIKMPDGSEQLISDNIIGAYFAMLKKAKTQEELPDFDRKIVNYVSQEVEKIEYDFNPESYRTTKKEEDKARQKDEQDVKENNALVKALKTAINDELKNFHKNGRKKEFLPEDEVLSIEVAEKNNNEYFVITYANHEETLDIPVKKNNKGKKGSIFNLTNGDSKKGLSSALHDKLTKQKEKVLLVDKQKSSEVGKKYSPSEYKKLSGLEDKEQIDKELKILNTLSSSDQKRYKEALNERKKFWAIKSKTLAKVSSYIDKLAQQGAVSTLEALDGYGNLMKELFAIPSELAKEKGQEIDSKDNFVSKFIGGDSALWNKYSKNNDEERDEHSVYEKKLIHVIEADKNGKKRSCEQICKDILELPNENIEQDIYDSFREIQNITSPMLPRKLASEIFTYGVFRASLSNPSEQKFKKMNKVLNEFGLNIKFEEIEITNLPAEDIKKASDQYKKDREIFSATKKFAQHEKRERAFMEHARANDVKKPKDKSVHHYIALKYNAFVKDVKLGNTELPTLNNERNYIITARQNPWNIDAHDLVHRFDTAGSFLVKSEDGKIMQPDFNATREIKKKSGSKKLYILAPVLQKKENGKFVDLLSICDDKGNQGFYLSTNKSPDIISLPPYCNGERKPQEKTLTGNKKDGKNKD